MNQVQSKQNPTKMQADADQIKFALEVLAAEARAVQAIQLGDSFNAAVDLIITRTGHPDANKPSHAVGSLVIGGLGKSGLVGQKLSATFASTGTPSHFLHPSEAMHGDLGKIRKNDVVLLLSYGGNTQEVTQLALYLRQDGVPIISITGKTECDLARLATCALTVGDVTEACPLNLAPTASTTAMMALGDALALTVSRRRGFSEQDFRKFHPGGNLGRELTPILDAIRFKTGQNLSMIQETETIEGAFKRAEAAAQGSRRAGALVIVNVQGELSGIFTDGDLRKHLIKSGPSVMGKPIGDLMTRNPKKLASDARVRDAVRIMNELRIDEIPVIDPEGKPLGLIDVQDLMALKVIEG